MSSLRKELLKSGLPPLPSGQLLSHRSATDSAKRRKRNYSPLSWNDFFHKSEDVTTSSKNVAVSNLMDCQIVAMDIRGHGSTKTTDDNDLTARTLVNDVVELVGCLFNREQAPPIIIMGHSMGGAIAVRVAAEQSIPSLLGLVVIDVVEGTAMDSLTSMQSFLRGRPSTFKSLDYAIEWSIRSGQLRNLESARVSMPGQLSRCSALPVTPKEVTLRYNRRDVAQQPILEEPQPNDLVSTAGISEQGTELKEEPTADDKYSGELYTWRIDLSKTEKYWCGWFQGLSKLFLSLPLAKLIILAGVDRLDKELTIGQMQGKFQMEVLTGCGHSVHEDAPEKVAVIVANFLTRHTG